VILVGELSLWLALLMCLWSATLSFAGGHLRRDDLAASGARGLHAAAACVLLAALGLWTALLTNDFALGYVASVSTANLPLPFKVSAFWAGRPGVMLLWGLVLALPAALLARRLRGRDRAAMPWVTGTLALVLLVLLLAAALPASPFARVEWAPAEGSGLEPRLQHLATALHPLLLTAGYALSTIPFALAVGAFASGRASAAWPGAVRRPALWCWLFLTAGILCGMWGAYAAPGAGGIWVWGPTEDFAILPWIAVTALLHGLPIEEERGNLRQSNTLLVVATFALSILGTFITGPGAIPSGDAVMRTAGAAAFIRAASLTLGLLMLAGVATAWWLASRRPSRAARDGRRWAGHLAHAGFVILGVAITGSTLRQGHEVTLADGASFTTQDPFGRDWTFTNDGLSQYRVLNRDVLAVTLRAEKDGRPVRSLTSEQRQYVDSRGALTFEPITDVGILHAARQDVLLALRGVFADEVDVRIDFNPMMSWVWVGGALLLIGGLVRLWPRASSRARDAGARAAASAAGASSAGADDPAERLIARVKARPTTCPTCGPRPEPDALFCSDCGSYLAAACLRCGAAVEERDARYCTECGHSLAA
jgi:cytochrome c biogenesis factor